MAKVVDVRLVDHIDEVMREFEKNGEAALEAVGLQCVSHAQNNITARIPRHAGSWYVSKGAAGLKGSINHKVVMSEKAVYVGSNAAHAIYNELGTGKYAEGGKGRQGWWVFVPNSSSATRKQTGKIYTEAEARMIVAILRSQGLDAHMTQGISAIHFLRDAVQDYKDEYKSIFKEYLSK